MFQIFYGHGRQTPPSDHETHESQSQHPHHGDIINHSLTDQPPQGQLIQCRDGAQDQRNITVLLELAAGPPLHPAKKREGAEAEVEGEGGAPRRKRQRGAREAVRGAGQYVYDEEGVRYLDCAASVSHVGHSHPRLLKVGEGTSILW